MMNAKEIAWARRHDWCVGTVAGGVRVREVIREADGSLTDQETTITSFAQLRRWAGY